MRSVGTPLPGVEIKIIDTEGNVVPPRVVGEIATPSTDLHPGDFGQAELRGSSWKVRNIGGVSIRAGQRCIVEQVDGLTIHIRAAE